MRRCRARSRRPWRRRCGLVGSAVLRATFWPTTALLLLLVASLLAICFVLHCCCGTRYSATVKWFPFFHTYLIFLAWRDLTRRPYDHSPWLSLATSGKWELVSSVVSWALGVPFVPAEVGLGITGGGVGILAFLLFGWAKS